MLQYAARLAGRIDSNLTGQDMDHRKALFGHGPRSMRILGIAFFMSLSLPFEADACPTGMLYDGNGCSPPYEYSMDDWIREKNDYLDSLGPKERAPTYSLTPEEVENLKKLQAEKDARDARIAQEVAKGIWFFASSATPEGKLCTASFAKMTSQDNGKSGGIVSIMGFQRPKPDAWLIFYGTGLPQPKKVKKIKISLQQDDEPAQTVQVFNYKYQARAGAIAFSVPGLTAALDGMRDKQSFKLSIDGNIALALQWADAAPVIEQLRQCAK